jgi:hypothetical protein
MLRSARESPMRSKGSSRLFEVRFGQFTFTERGSSRKIYKLAARHRARQLIVQGPNDQSMQITKQLQVHSKKILQAALTQIAGTSSFFHIFEIWSEFLFSN